MKDIPVFTGTHGIATLVLSPIPWCGSAYVLVRSVWTDAAAFLEECLGFCRACGAERVYASYELADLPAEHAYDMLSLQRPKAGLPEGEIPTEPLTEENAHEFLEIYDSCFRQIPNAAPYGRRDVERLLQEETAVLVRRDGQCAAIAQVSRQGLEAIAVLPRYRGLGYDLALTALKMVPSVTLQLKTASCNEKALALYERLGFEKTAVLSRWWKLM